MSSPVPSSDQVQACKRQILAVVVAERVSLAEACRSIERLVSPELVQLARAEIRSDMESNWPVTTAVTNPETSGALGEAWYVPPPRDPCWSHYLEQLRAANSPALEQLDSETTEIVRLLANPNLDGCRRKGLVMGNVQSGKTRNYGGVAAKAADAGYRFVIVLAGLHDNLRDQTQSRLDAQLFDRNRWYSVTQVGDDFERIHSPEQVFDRMPVVAAVVKKNVYRLDRLIATLEQVPFEHRRRLPVLIIDDEADQATPNSLAQRQRISAINRRVRRLWSLVQRGTYLAYTATPFANVLIDPDEPGDLFPSDFLKSIPPGDGYFGAERVFGLAETVDEHGNGRDGLDMVRLVPAADAGALRPPSDRQARQLFDPELPTSLKDALNWFVVASAIRRARGQRGHSSMLVHTTHYTDPHAAMRLRLVDFARSMARDVAAGDVDTLRASWNHEAQSVASEATVDLPSWEDVAAEVPQVLEDLEVIMDNGVSEDRLNYDGDEPKTVIAVGGGTLSRGLTLEGLVVSYFTRTANAYDTLLQMGRWFGYRPGYEDLPRVWVTDGLDEDYAFLARVELDLRAEIESVQGSEFTPAQVGVRVRAHPGRLQVTAANRMWAANVVQLGLTETSNQTFILSAADTDRNLAAVESLLQGTPIEDLPFTRPRMIARGVEGSRVSEFLAAFSVHRDQRWLADESNVENMRQWMAANAVGPTWNVVLASNSRTLTPDGRTELGSLEVCGQRLNCLNRSPLQGSSQERLDFKAIASPNDRIADIDPALYAGEPHETDAQRRRIRRAHANRQGLVVIYPISGRSRAAQPSDEGRVTRMDMPGGQHVLGFAIFFPAVNDTTGREGTFVSVRRTWEVADAAEGDEDDLAAQDADGTSNAHEGE